MTEQAWGFTGPASVTYFLEKTGEIEHAHPQTVFYPISFPDRNHMIMSRFNIEERLTEQTRGVHFWARRMKPRLEEKENNTPRRGSFMEGLIAKHGIDPAAAPIPAKKKVSNAPVNDPDFMAKIGIEALKGEASITKICRDHLVDKQFVKTCRDTIQNNAATLFARDG